MTKRCAHLNLTTNIVENIIIADPATDEPWPGYLLIADLPPFVQIGSEWDGKEFIKPPVPDAPFAAVAPKMRMI